ncbi:hypothetical protein HPP92_025573 [Vanilla planifolia]|uniref:Ribosomal L28e/Mak16 domain-containing protein n=1 Tax=Vanilla planifolia TaxID=51239 RepID=A0A835U949_VANPL|nr:hypothetical protein HPP92_025573 [Vanilla planifolia]
MSGISDPLVWEIVKSNNAFLVKQFGCGNAMVQFSKVWQTRRQCRFNLKGRISLFSVLKKEFRKVAKLVINQLHQIHLHHALKRPALARLDAVVLSLEVAKSGSKKRNRQAHEVRN